MDYMLNNVVEQLLFLGVIWNCGYVRKCPCNGKMHTYVFRGEASYLHPVFRLSKGKCGGGGLHSTIFFTFLWV